MKNTLPAACKFSMASMKALALKCWLDGALKLHPRGKNQCASIKKGRNFTKAVNRKFKKLDSFISFPSFFFHYYSFKTPLLYDNANYKTIILDLSPSTVSY